MGKALAGSSFKLVAKTDYKDTLKIFGGNGKFVDGAAETKGQKASFDVIYEYDAETNEKEANDLSLQFVFKSNDSKGDGKGQTITIEMNKEGTKITSIKHSVWSGDLVIVKDVVLKDGVVVAKVAEAEIKVGEPATGVTAAAVDEDGNATVVVPEKVYVELVFSKGGSWFMIILIGSILLIGVIVVVFMMMGGSDPEDSGDEEAPKAKKDADKDNKDG